jgi:hypothetical protein
LALGPRADVLRSRSIHPAMPRPAAPRPPGRQLPGTPAPFSPAGQACSWCAWAPTCGSRRPRRASRPATSRPTTSTGLAAAVHSITFSRWLPPQETGSSSLPSRRPPASRCQAQPASQAGARHRPSASACQSQCGRAAALGGGQGAPPSVPKGRAVACIASAGGAREDWMLLRWCVGLGPHPADPL